MSDGKVVDYFYTCGLDEKMGLEPCILGEKAGSDRCLLPLERTFKCKVLQHFPEYLPKSSFDAESTSVVTMPNGLPLYTQKHLCSQKTLLPQRHTFIITRENGSRMHGLALIFPVEITNRNVLEAVCSLQDLVFGRSRGNFTAEPLTLYDPTQDKLFTMKAFGLLSRYPFIHGLFGWLEDLWATMFIASPITTDVSSIESCVSQLLYETTLPPQMGRFITFAGAFRQHWGYYPALGKPVQTLLGGSVDVFDAMELPLFEYCLLDLLRLIQLDDLLRLLTCVLMEHRIILISKEYYRLMLVAEGITCFLLPFSWSNVYAPILPLSLVHFVDAPVPYIMGIKQCEHTRGPHKSANHDCHAAGITAVELASETNVCYVYIDDSRVIIPDEVPEFPNAKRVTQSLSRLLLTASTLWSPTTAQSLECVDGAPERTSAPVSRPRPPASLISSQWSDWRSVGPPNVSSDIGLPTHPTVDADVAIVSRSETSELESAEQYFRACAKLARHLVTSETFSAYTQLLHFNTAVRTVFLCNFASIFRNYDKFLIFDGGIDNVSGLESAKQSGLHAFDKVGFLSDQPETHLPFLSPFMETQMFASFLDHRMNYPAFSSSSTSAQSPATSTHLALFDQMVARIGDVSMNSHHSAAVKHCWVTDEVPVSADPIFHSRAHWFEANLDKTSLLRAPPFGVVEPLPDLLSGATSKSTPNRSGPSHHGFPPLMLPQSTLEQHFMHYAESACIKGADLGHFPSLCRDLLACSAVPSYEPFDMTDFPRSAIYDPISPTALPATHVSRRPCVPTNSAPVSPPFDPNPDVYTRPRASVGFMSTPIKRSTPFDRLSAEVPSVEQPSLPFTKSRIIHSFAQSHHLAATQHTGGMAQTNWDFVDALLDECKHRIRRMVLKKMGHEAVALGHTDPTVSAVEENTLVSGLCDLLERIWSHGLVKKSGKSALWSHLIQYVQRHHITDQQTGTRDPNVPSLVEQSGSSSTSSHGDSPVSAGLPKTPGASSTSFTLVRSAEQGAKYAMDTLSKRIPPNQRASSVSRFESSTSSTLHSRFVDSSPSKSVLATFDWRTFIPSGRGRGVLSRRNSIKSPLFTRTAASATDTGVDSQMDLLSIFGPTFGQPNIINDIVTVQNVGGVKTDIGFARAFVRLALEKKLLSAYLTQLLLDVKLLRKLYSRYAFLRCEEEREQFLLHLLSLNAVDYYSFTRMVTQAHVMYHVYICSGRKYGFAPTANLWIRMHGHLGSTPVVSLPHGEQLTKIRYSNLGLLSVIQVGHDNSGPTPKWFVEYVLIHNTITHHLYLFPCGHWLGRGIEDDALERLLIGERVQLSDRYSNSAPPGSAVVSSSRVLHSGLIPRPTADMRTRTAVETHEHLANAVNQLLKHFAKNHGRQNVTSLTRLWCGERGLVPSIQQVFYYGFRSGRLFQRRVYVWDYLEKVASAFAIELGLSNRAPSTLPSPIPSTIRQRPSPGYSTHSLPRPSRSKLLHAIGSLTPKSIHPSPSLFAVQDHAVLDANRLDAYAYSQPNSPALMRGGSVAPTSDLSPSSSNTRLTVVNRCNLIAALRHPATQLVTHIRTITSNGALLGKEGRLQRFICLAVREHLLVSWLSVLACSPITGQMYEAKSFLLDHQLRMTIQSLVSALDPFDFPLEPVLFGDN